MRIGNRYRVLIANGVLACLTASLATLVYMRYPTVQNEDRSASVSQSLPRAEVDPEEIARLRESAAMHFEAEEWEDAAADLTQEIEVYAATNEPRWVACKALVLRSQCNLNLGRTDQALEDCNAAIEVLPDAATAYTCRALIYLQLREYDKAIRDSSRAIELNPNEPMPYGTRAAGYLATNQYEFAIPDVTKVIDANPEVATLYRNRAKSYTEVGRHEESIADYTRAIALEPDRAEQYRERAIVYRKLGLPAAEDDYQIYAALKDHRRLQNEPVEDLMRGASADARRLYEEAVSLLEKSRWHEAIATVNKLIDLPNETNACRSHAHVLCAHCRLRTGQFAEGMNNANEAIRLKPNYGGAYALRTAFHWQLEENDQTIEDAMKAIEFRGDQLYCRRLLVESYVAIADYDSAKREIAVIIALSPKKAGNYVARARLYRDLGQHEDALADYSKAISLEPDNPAHYQGRGEIRTLMGQTQAAYDDHRMYRTLQNRRGPRVVYSEEKLHEQLPGSASPSSSSENEAVTNETMEGTNSLLEFGEMSMRTKIKW